MSTFDTRPWTWIALFAPGHEGSTDDPTDEGV